MEAADSRLVAPPNRGTALAAWMRRILLIGLESAADL
jgi:hypothetical protein